MPTTWGIDQENPELKAEVRRLNLIIFVIMLMMMTVISHDCDDDDDENDLLSLRLHILVNDNPLMFPPGHMQWRLLGFLHLKIEKQINILSTSFF